MGQVGFGPAGDEEIEVCDAAVDEVGLEVTVRAARLPRRGASRGDQPGTHEGWEQLSERSGKAESQAAGAARLSATRTVMLYSATFAGRPVSTTLPAVLCRIRRVQEHIGGEGHEG